MFIQSYAGFTVTRWPGALTGLSKLHTFSRVTRLCLFLLIAGLTCPAEAAAGDGTTGKYGRMLPKGDAASDELIAKVKTLAGGLMNDVGLPTVGSAQAGYTYFGQLIDHDLTFDLPLEQAGMYEPEDVPNGRTPWLDLDQIYGSSQGKNKEIFEGPPGAEKFIIHHEVDLPIVNGRKKLGDPLDNRDLENVILLQLHVLFMKLHNLAIDQCMDPEMQHVGPSKGTRFQRAHRLVVWHYQRLVDQDYLPKTVNHAVLRHVRSKGPYFTWKRDGFFIPVEFSNAAFRFGHSMVRGTYTLNDAHKDSPLEALIAPELTTRPLAADWIIDWRHFFSPVADPSLPIDTQLTKDLGDIPPFSRALFSNPALMHKHMVDPAAGPADLPARSLVRGVRNRLPTGQQVARSFAHNELTRAQLTGECGPTGKPDKAGAVLIEAGLVEKTPLFFYLLREAEVTGGERLGAAGSRIVADVIEGSLRHAPNVYPRDPKKPWVLPTWRFPDDSRAPVDTLQKFVELVAP